MLATASYLLPSHQADQLTDASALDLDTTPSEHSFTQLALSFLPHGRNLFDRQNGRNDRDRTSAAAAQWLARLGQILGSHPDMRFAQLEGAQGCAMTSI